MGNIPAKITGKYQSYDINTPSHSTPQIPVRHQDQIESHLSKEECAPVVASDEHNEQQDEVNFNQTANSAANSVYNEQPVDAGDDGK